MGSTNSIYLAGERGDSKEKNYLEKGEKKKKDRERAIRTGKLAKMLFKSS